MLRKQDQVRARISLLPPNSIDEAPPTGADLQMIEAVNIVKDMVEMEENAAPSAAAKGFDFQELLKKTGS
jgi:hypothetical protein